MIQPDKQVKDLYNAVLREVISTIREDPLILHAGIQSNVIDALEEVDSGLISEVEEEHPDSERLAKRHSGRLWRLVARLPSETWVHARYGRHFHESWPRRTDLQHGGSKLSASPNPAKNSSVSARCSTNDGIIQNTSGDDVGRSPGLPGG